MYDFSKSHHEQTLSVSPPSHHRGIFIVVVALLSGIAIAGVVWFALVPPSSFKAPVTVVIPPGSSLRDVGRLLRAQNLVRSSALFEFYTTLIGGEHAIKAGEYLFQKPAPAFRIAARIVHGAYGFPQIAVTFPEGSTRQEIVLIIERARVFSAFNAQKFLLITEHDEGYLFPDTYFFLENIRAERVAELLKATFAQKVAIEKKAIDESGHTQSEIVTMASLIEAEARTADDRRIVSGILWKRLAINMPLQVDVARVTYQYHGLPSDPINNPGLDSIDAAIHPARTPYLYYLSDRSGTIHYATTYTQHKKNVAQYLASS
ncbi:MAG: endolytic transglycosylase MltG [Minisyncoccota bacterium]